MNPPSPENRPEADFDPLAAEEADKAAAEAGRIGGNPGEYQTDDPAQIPLEESGEGEREGFEDSDDLLIEHASHGDQHAARHALQDAFDESDDARATEGGEADQEIPPDV